MADKKLFDMSGTEVMSTGVLKTSRLPGCYASNSGGEVVEVNQLFNVTDALDAMTGNPANQKILCYDSDNSDARYLTVQNINKLANNVVGVKKDGTITGAFEIDDTSILAFGKSPFTIIMQVSFPFNLNSYYTGLSSDQILFSSGTFSITGAKSAGVCALYQIGSTNSLRYVEVKTTGTPGVTTNIMETIELSSGIHTIMISRDVFGNKSSIWVDGIPSTPTSVERVSGDILSLIRNVGTFSFYLGDKITQYFSRVSILNFALDPLKDKKLAIDIFNNGRFDSYTFPSYINHGKCIGDNTEVSLDNNTAFYML